MNKKMSKMMRILLVLMFLFTIFNSVVLASGTNPIQQVQGHIQSPGDTAIATMDSLRSRIYMVYRIVGTGIAVIAILILAVKYIISSPNDRADLKKALIIYTISAILFFGTVGIVEIIKRFSGEIL